MTDDTQEKHSTSTASELQDDEPADEAAHDAGQASDDGTDDRASGEASAGNGRASADDGGVAADVDAERVGRYLNYLLIGGLTLFAVVAAVQFYLNASAAIGRWVAPAYRSLFQAVFNLAVLLVAVAGISRQLARLR